MIDAATLKIWHEQLVQLWNIVQELVVTFWEKLILLVQQLLTLLERLVLLMQQIQTLQNPIIVTGTD